jgi:hypothetical protein
VTLGALDFLFLAAHLAVYVKKCLLAALDAEYLQGQTARRALLVFLLHLGLTLRTANENRRFLSAVGAGRIFGQD